jgi:hypothetical protein
MEVPEIPPPYGGEIPSVPRTGQAGGFRQRDHQEWYAAQGASMMVIRFSALEMTDAGTTLQPLVKVP